MSQQNPETYLPYVAGTLNNLGNLHRAQNRREDAREAYEEALKIYRQLAQQNPETCLPYLATTLTGLPFHRVERLEGSLGIPLPAATQWGIVEHGGHQLEPALDELTRQAAQGEIFHNDDSATSEGWRVQWESIPPGEKPETCSLDGKQEGILFAIFHDPYCC